MSLKATIRQAVNQIFSAASDLVVTATLHKTEQVAYNWSSGAYSSSDSSLVVEVIPTETEVSGGENSSSPFTTFVVRSEHVSVDFGLYTVLSVASIDYRIESFTQYEGIVILKTRRG